jgi:hypothetical protein
VTSTGIFLAQADVDVSWVTIYQNETPSNAQTLSDDPMLSGGEGFASLYASYPQGGGTPNYQYGLRFSLTGSQTQDIDLALLTGIWQEQWSFYAIDNILVRIRNKQPGQYVTVLPSPVNGWTGWIPAGGELTVLNRNLWEGPWNVDLTAGTLRIANGDSSAKVVDFACIGQAQSNNSLLLAGGTAGPILLTDGTTMLRAGQLN